MSDRLTFYFDLVCPFAYLASVRVEGTAAAVGASVDYRPVLLGGILKSVAKDPYFTTRLPPAKARHNMADAARWAAYHQIPFQWHPRHPIRTLTAMRALMVTGPEPGLISALYRTYWVEQGDLADPVTLRAVLDAQGFDGVGVLEAAQTPAVKAQLRAATDAAVERGLFGVPTFFLGGEMYYGQDRLDFAAERFQGAA